MNGTSKVYLRTSRMLGLVVRGQVRFSQISPPLDIVNWLMHASYVYTISLRLAPIMYTFTIICKRDGPRLNQTFCNCGELRLNNY